MEFPTLRLQKPIRIEVPLKANPTLATFIGIDLAWKSDRNPTGAAVLRGNRSGAKLETLSTLRSHQAVLDFVRANTRENTVLAIDAPLIIVNETGQRVCETAVGKRYGKHDASCHTSNLKRYKDASSVTLTTSLLADGFVHVRKDHEGREGCIVAEVYPHAAMVALFGLEQIIKYKKGPIATRRLGLKEMRTKLEGLTKAKPQILRTDTLRDLLKTDLEVLSGRALKNYEDILDAVFCAYLAFYFWYWGWKRNELFGDLEGGYILNPKLTNASL